MPLTIPTVGPYPTIEEVFQNTRLHINNAGGGATAMVGESRRMVDPWTPSMQLLNLALQGLQRDLEYYGYPKTKEVVWIINGITPINSALGLGVPNPTVQVYLGFDGYFNGLTLGVTPTLPSDLLEPVWIGQRITNSGTLFSELPMAGDDLPSINQNYLLGFWTWRQDRIVMNGSQNTMDIQLRYIGGYPRYANNLNPDLWITTLIPFLDSAEALSYKVALLFVAPRAAQYPPGAVEYIESSYKSAMVLMANRYVIGLQRNPVSRAPFGTTGGSGVVGEGWGGIGNS